MSRLTPLEEELLTELLALETAPVRRLRDLELVALRHGPLYRAAHWQVVLRRLEPDFGFLQARGTFVALVLDWVAQIPKEDFDRLTLGPQEHHPYHFAVLLGNLHRRVQQMGPEFYP